MLKKWVLFGMMFLLVPWLLVGCGVAQELYDAVVAERDSLAADLQSVQGELDAAKSKVQSVESELEALKLELESASSELESATGELDTVKSELEEALTQLIEAQAPVVPPPSPPTMESLTYTNSEYGFLVKYPKDWDFTEGITDTIVVFSGPFIAEEEVFINILIGAEELPKYPKWTLEDFVSTSKLQLKALMENYEDVDEYRTTVDDLPAIVSSFTYDMDGFTIMQTMVSFFKEENVAYSIVYTATPTTNDESLDSLELMMSSFEFK